MIKRKDLLLVAAGLVFFIAVGIILEQAKIFSPLKQAMRSQSVPSGLLKGTKGKILKRLGVVMAVPNDYSLFPASTTTQGDENVPIFQKKRRVGKFLYRVNPGGEKDMPSSLIINKDNHLEGWPLLSVTVSENDLFHPGTGIITNYKGRGSKWERLAYASYFEKGKLLFATAVGLRLHGGYIRNPPKEWEQRNYSFRLYFRDEYGADRFKTGLLFDAECEPIKHLVVHNIASWQQRYTPCIAFDIARRIGCRVPQTKLAQFYLNGKPQGYYYLSEHVNKTQWVSHMGHKNFAFYRPRGGNDKETMKDYRGLLEWARDPRLKMTVKEVGKYVDIDNLSRHLFSWMFCGTTDQVQGAAVLDREQPGARWYWIIWDMDQSFFNSQSRNPRLEHWQQKALPLAVCIGNWQSASDARQVLFTRLLMDSPEYREYFVRLTMDLLNHRLSPGYLNSLVAGYEKLPVPHGCVKSLTKEEYRVKDDLGKLGEYMEHRPYFIRKEIQDYFGTGEMFVCQVRCAPGYRYNIDGYPEEGNYRGHYYKGKSITIEMVGSRQDKRMFSHWLVNGRKYLTAVLSFPVEGDTIISPVMIDEVLLLDLAGRGAAADLTAILKRGTRKQLTYLAMIEAVEKGHEGVLKVLIENGADVHAEVDRGVTLLTHALTLNRRGIIDMLRNAGARFPLDRFKTPGQLLNNFIEAELKSPRCKEWKLWHPGSPSPHIQGVRGKFAFDFQGEKESAVLVVSNLEPGKEGERICQFGYSANENGLAVEIPAGRYVYFVVTANIPGHLIDKDNYLFIQDFDGRWERETVYFSSGGWSTYLVSKKIRPRSTGLQFGFRFVPRSAADRLMIADVKVFISNKDE